MDDYLQRKAACARWVTDMHHALAQDDEHAFRAALEQFRTDSRLVDLAERQVPDARARLLHVLKLTDDAAHHTMDLVDQSCPLVEHVAETAALLLSTDSRPAYRGKPQWSEVAAFLSATVGHMKALRSRLAEVLLAQGYQDLSGQILRRVMTLADGLEVALGDLVRIGNLPGARDAQPETGAGQGFGPGVPGIAHGATVSGQQDVDAMLSGLGF